MVVPKPRLEFLGYDLEFCQLPNVISKFRSRASALVKFSATAQYSKNPEPEKCCIRCMNLTRRERERVEFVLVKGCSIIFYFCSGTEQGMTAKKEAAFSHRRD